MIFAPSGYEWQTAAVFGCILAYAMWTLYRWHTAPEFKDFCLLDLIAEGGRLSSRKFMEMGCFIVSSAVVVIVTVRGSVSWEWIAGYSSVFVLGRAVGQSVHAYREVREQNNLGGKFELETEDDLDRPPARPRRESIIR